MKKIKKACKETAQGFLMKDCARRALDIYVSLTINRGFSRRQTEDGFWSNAIRSFQTQWGLAKNLTHATEAYYKSSVPEALSHAHKDQTLAEAHVQN